MSSKAISDNTAEERPVRKVMPPPANDYVNPAEEAPLNSNQDFMAILEREMAKERGQQSMPAKKSNYKAPSPSIPAEDD